MKFAIVVLAMFSSLLSAETLQFVAEDLPPYHFYDEKGQPQGALVEVVKALAQEANVEYDIALYPFARAYKRLQTKPNVLMFSLLRSPGRENEFLWLGKTFHNTAYLVSLRNRELQLTNLEQAKQYSVGTIRGYYSETYLCDDGFREGSNLSLSVNYQNLWQMLFNHRIDFVLTNTLSMTTELNELGLDVSNVKSVLELQDFPSELNLAANLELDPSIALVLQQSLDAIKANGEYQRILSHWNLE